MRKQWRWYVYVIECLNGRYYTGCTWSVSNRIEQHISRQGSKYTNRYGFKKLVYVEEFDNLGNARQREVQIKNWSQEKKRKLISGEWKKEW